MYHPISFNVIRQALEWHGMPVPMLHQLSFYDNELHGETSAEYLATWTPDQAASVAVQPEVPHAPHLCPLFSEKLRACFCDDVAVLGITRNPTNGTIICVLYVRVSTFIGNWHEHILNDF